MQFAPAEAFPNRTRLRLRRHRRQGIDPKFFDSWSINGVLGDYSREFAIHSTSPSKAEVIVAWMWTAFTRRNPAGPSGPGLVRQVSEHSPSAASLDQVAGPSRLVGTNRPALSGATATPREVAVRHRRVHSFFRPLVSMSTQPVCCYGNHRSRDG